MATDTRTKQEPPLGQAAEQVAEPAPAPDRVPGEGEGAGAGELRWRKRRKRLGRKRSKFPRWVRALIWIVTPVVLWLGVYGIGLLLL